MRVLGGGAHLCHSACARLCTLPRPLTLDHQIHSLPP